MVYIVCIMKTFKHNVLIGQKLWTEHSGEDVSVINLAADGLLVLPAALLSALDGFDAEAGPASGTRGLTSGAGGFLFILEQLHEQFKLWTAGRLFTDATKERCITLAVLHTQGFFSLYSIHADPYCTKPNKAQPQL